MSASMAGGVLRGASFLERPCSEDSPLGQTVVVSSEHGSSRRDVGEQMVLRHRLSRGWCSGFRTRASWLGRVRGGGRPRASRHRSRGRARGPEGRPAGPPLELRPQVGAQGPHFGVGPMFAAQRRPISEVARRWPRTSASSPANPPRKRGSRADQVLEGSRVLLRRGEQRSRRTVDAGSKQEDRPEASARGVWQLPVGHTESPPTEGGPRRARNNDFACVRWEARCESVAERRTAGRQWLHGQRTQDLHEMLRLLGQAEVTGPDVGGACYEKP